MSTRTSALLLLVGIGATDLTFRIAQVAVPLVALAGTGSPAAMGLAAGASGVPVLASPWWARRLRQRIRSGTTIAGCYLGEAAALALVAGAASAGALNVALLVASGLLLGTAEALSGPGRDALLSDLGSLRSADHALRLLTVREFFRRVSMVIGPLLGGLAVAAGHTVTLLWVDVAAVLLSAALAAPVRAIHGTADDDAPSIWSTVRRDPDVLAGWVVRGVGCLLWFAFSLGLALLGVERGRPGQVVAVGLAAYGVGSVGATLGVLRLVARVRPLPAIAAAWAVCGLCWAAIGLTPSTPVVAAASLLAGATVVVGNTAVTAQITRVAESADRRALLAGQSVVVNATGSSGLLLGGPVLAIAGARPTLVGAGSILVVLSLAAWVEPWLRRPQGRRPRDQSAEAMPAQARNHDMRVAWESWV